MANITFEARGMYQAFSEREKADGAKYAVLDILVANHSYGSNQRPVKMICFVPAIYLALKENEYYRLKGIVSLLRGNTFLTLTHVEDEYGREVYNEPNEPEPYDDTGENEIPY